MVILDECIQGNVDSELQQAEARFAELFNAMSHCFDSKKLKVCVMMPMLVPPWL